MRGIGFLTVFGLGCLLLQFPVSSSAVDYVMHHGQSVANSEDPQVCLTCHALYAEINHHSILMNYPPRRKENQFKPLESLTAAGGRLYNGYITCASCHNLITTTSAHLITDTSESKLCFVCHQK